MCNSCSMNPDLMANSLWGQNSGPLWGSVNTQATVNGHSSCSSICSGAPGTQPPYPNYHQLGGFNPFMMMMMVMGFKQAKKSKKSESYTVSKAVEPSAEAEEPKEKMTVRKALEIIKNNFLTVETTRGGKKDGKAGLCDLEEIVGSDAYNAELKEAAQFLISKMDIFNLMQKADDKDNSNDNKFTEKDIEKFIDNNPSLLDIS